jgi:primase-polymerase (primpol)-like protein
VTIASTKTDPNIKPAKMPVYADGIPFELRKRRQWVLWNWHWNGKKWDKPPLVLSGRPASSTDPETWTSFEEAYAAHAAGLFDGIGYVFTPDDPYCGIDLDSCRDPETGDLADWAVDLIHRLDFYAELSPSGMGGEIWTRAKKQVAKCKKKFESGEVEIFDSGRYFTVTGQRFPGTPETINDRLQEVNDLCELVFNPPKKPRQGQPLYASNGNGEGLPVLLDDNAIIHKASAAKNGPKFRRLFGGDASDYSRADGTDDSSFRRQNCFLAGLLVFLLQHGTVHIRHLAIGAAIYASHAPAVLLVVEHRFGSTLTNLRKLKLSHAGEDREHQLGHCLTGRSGGVHAF